MEVKKSKKAEMESKRGTWLLLGFTAVLACMFVAFEWTEHEKDLGLMGRTNVEVLPEELVPITIFEAPKPPPPPAQAAIENFEIAPDDVDVKEGTIEGDEDDPNVGVDVKPMAPPQIEDIDETPTDFVIVEDMPAFPGGQSELMKFLSKNIHYPAIAQETNTQGRVIVQFVVDVDGSIINPVIARSVDPHLDKEALRVIMSMPKWKPGYQRGKAVRVKYTVPVTFKLK